MKNTAERTNNDPIHNCAHHCLPKTIHIGMVAVGMNATRAMVTVVKSILLFRSTPLHLHVIVDGSTQDTLSTIFDTWGVQCLTVTTHVLTNHTAEIAWVRTSHSSSMFGLSKLIYERLLPDVSRIIAIDTDLIFNADIAHLWALFDDFDEQQMIGAVEQQSDWYLPLASHMPIELIWPAIGHGINSGVMLLHLDRMRASKWHTTWSALTRQQLTVQQRAPLADQDVFNLVMSRKPRLFATLPCQWNVQIHKFSVLFPCIGAPPHVLHWNSPDRLAAPHPTITLLRSMQSRVAMTDSTTLRDAPPMCLPATFQMQEDVINGTCDELRAAAKRIYRVHADYYTPVPQKRLFRCRLLGDDAVQANKHLVSRKQHNIRAQSALFAEHQFFKMIKEQQVNTSIVWPRELLPACSDVTDKLRNSKLGVDVTLCTQLSMDRLQALPKLVQQWGGPMSVALYVHDAELPLLDKFIADYADAFNSNDGLRLHCVLREGSVHPINYLRNIALDYVTTSFVFNVDIDFVVGPRNAHDLLNSRIEAESKLFQQNERIAFVVPSFETDRYRAAVPDSKAEMHEMFMTKKMRQFRVDEWPKGHAPTDYDAWFRASMAYQVFWAEGFEPFLVLQTKHAHFDARFVGFGWNKISQIELLNAMRFLFYGLMRLCRMQVSDHICSCAGCVHRAHTTRAVKRSDRVSLICWIQKLYCAVLSRVPRRARDNAVNGTTVSCHSSQLLLCVGGCSRNRFALA